MIFDRTQEIVDAAKRIRDEKVKNFYELTESDISILERGTLTINTLNRIEEKQEELKHLLNAMGYWNTVTSNRRWDYSDIFNEEEYERILENARVFRKAFFVYSGTPDTPKVSYHFQSINDLERILFDMDVMINDIKSKYRRCGTFRCGEGNI